MAKDFPIGQMFPSEAAAVHSHVKALRILGETLDWGRIAKVLDLPFLLVWGVAKEAGWITWSAPDHSATAYDWIFGNSNAAETVTLEL